MGSNTYRRKFFTDAELEELIEKIDGFKSLFDTREFRSEKEWRANVARYLDPESSNRFYFRIEEKKGLPRCQFCSKELSIDSFEYSGYNKGFRKYCPNCRLKGVWKYAENYSPDTLKKRGEKIAKSKLEFYQTDAGKKTAESNGQKISNALKQFHLTDAGAIARKKSANFNSKLLRDRILSGDFTPNSNNRNTHWNSEFNGKKYRSSWEALYQCLNPEAEYETLRIPYTFNGKELIYIVDFIDHTTKTVVEVKPKEMLSDEQTKSKLLALTQWATDHNYKVIIFTLDTIKQYPEPSYSLFDEQTSAKLKKLYAKIKN